MTLTSVSNVCMDSASCVLQLEAICFGFPVLFFKAFIYLHFGKLGLPNLLFTHCLLLLFTTLCSCKEWTSELTVSSESQSHAESNKMCSLNASHPQGLTGQCWFCCEHSVDLTLYFSSHPFSNIVCCPSCRCSSCNLKKVSLGRWST